MTKFNSFLDTNKFSFFALILIVIICLCFSLNTKITESPIKDDAAQNLRAAYNLSKWGIFSIRRGISKQPIPDNYREPLPPFAVSILMGFYLNKAPYLTDKDFIRGQYSRLIKQINLLWSFLVLLGTAVLTFMITRNRFSTICSVILVYLCFLRNPQYIDRFYSEIPTAALMLFSSILLLLSFRKLNPLLFLSAGISLGLLTLTKAVFLYIFFPIVISVVLYSLSSNLNVSIKTRYSFIILFILGMSVTTGPWMIRNKMHFDSFTITERGGAVLYGRALRNQMNKDEFIASFHLWGPGAYRILVQNTFLDVKESDYEKGGRASRLNRSGDSGFALTDLAAEKAGNPEKAISFHRQARAERVKARTLFQQSGHPTPQQASDDYLKKKAREMILKQPLRHLLMTIPFAWRGIWCFYGGGLFTILSVFCFISFITVPLFGVFRKKWDIIAFSAIPFLMVVFHASLTHNLNRYNSPAIPFMIISLFIVFKFFIEHHNKKSDIGSNN